MGEFAGDQAFTVSPVFATGTVATAPLARVVVITTTLTKTNRLPTIVRSPSARHQKITNQHGTTGFT